MKNEQALKFDNEKPGMDLLPVEAKKAIAEVFDFGAKKYARHNWRSGFNYSRLIAAAERHLDAFNDGEDLDPESGKSHLAHLGCCVLMLLEHTIKGYGTDDRFKPNNPDVPIGKKEVCTLADFKVFDNATAYTHPLHFPANDFKENINAPTVSNIAVGAWKPSENSTSDPVKISQQMSGMAESARKIESWLSRKMKETIK